MRFKALLAAVAIAAAGPAAAEPLLCAAQVIEKLPPDEWRFDYHGLLRSVTVIRYHAANAPNSVIVCRREYGAAVRSTSKACRLAAGEGQVLAAMQDKSEERFDCVFPPTSYEDNNDRTCQVICD